MRPLCSVITACAVLCGAQKALADTDTADFSYGGFGTLGYVTTDKHEFGFTRDLSQPRRSGLDEHVLPDSRLGIQANYRASSQLELAGQLVARDQVDLTLAHAVEWAFLAYHPIPEADLRFGRMGFDVFMLSEYRSVGYAYTWVRPVMEFYSWIPVNSFDGMDASYAFDSAAGRWRLKLLAGRSRTQTPSKINAGDYRLVFDSLWGGSLSHESGAWRTKLSFVKIRIASQPPTEPLTDALGAVAALSLPEISAEAERLADGLTVKGSRSHFAAFGTRYDDNVWLAEAEYSVLSGGSASVPQGWRGYISVGRRFGDWMPFGVLAWARPDEGRVATSADWSMLPGGVQLQNFAVDAINTGRISQRTASLGLRWEFCNTAAVKLQWDSTRVDPYGWGLWPDANQSRGETVNVFTTTLDWVF
jgi:hypothetical protein